MEVNLRLRGKLLLRLSPLSGIPSGTCMVLFCRKLSADQGGSSNRDIEEGRLEGKLRAGRGDGVNDDALSTAVA